MNEIQIEAGLWTQIRKLKKRIDSLDMDKVDPTELKAAVDSLKDMEARYSDMQEKKKQRRLDKETKEKAAPTQKESAPMDAPVEPIKEEPAPAPVATAPEAPPVEKASDMEVDAIKNQDVVDSFVSMTNPKARSQHVFIEVVSPDTWNLVNYNTVIATRDGDEIKLNYKYYSQTTRVIQNKIWWTAKQMGLTVLDSATGDPMELGGRPKKQVAPPVEQPVEEQEELPMAAEKKEATTSKYALDDIVEPVYGSAGSYGRIMRYDADKDLAYVHWDSGKLQADHGFGAYKGSDLRKRASLDKKAEEPGEPMGDVWNLESQDEEFAANILSGIVNKAIDGDVGEQQYLCSLWGEKWPQVKKKLEAEGSTWYVWWMDGVHEFMRGMQDEEQPAAEVKSEQEGIGYGGDRGGIAVAPKRDEDVSLTSGKYTGDMDKDLTVLMPHIVADGVAGQDRELSDWLVERARQIYKHNPEWGKKVARENDQARDFLYQFMEHWMKSKQSGANMESSLEASAPPGFKKTVEKMKKNPEIDNPFALGWWMKDQGYRPKKSSMDSDGTPDANDVVETYINGNISDAREWLAENPDLFPEAMALMREHDPRGAQRFVDLTYPYRKEASLNKTATSWIILPNGDLQITRSNDLFQPGTTNYTNISEEDLDSDRAMYELFEPVIANGLSWVAPEQIGALTDAPILSDSPGDDHGNADPKANYWWYPNYQVESPARELIEKGKVVFKKAALDKAAEWAVEYYPNDSDNMKVHKGFESKEQADKWVKAENIHDRGTDVSVYQIKTASLLKTATVTHREDGWHVLSEEGKNLGGPYKSKEEAVKRLRQVEYFKHHKGSLKVATSEGDTPETVRKQWDMDAPHFGGGMPHRWQEKDEQGKVRCNYCWRPRDYKPGSPVRPEEIQELRNVMGSKEADQVCYNCQTNPRMDCKQCGGTGHIKEKAAAGQPGEGQTMELNIANRKWTAKRTSGAGSPDAWVIFDDKGQQIMAITMSERELSQPELEQIVFNELGKKDLVRATLNVDLSIMKKGHKVKIVDVDVVRKEVKFASLESETLAGWTKMDRFDITIEAAEREPKLDRHCKECGAKIPLSFEEGALCRDCARKKEHPHKEAEFMPLSKSSNIVHIKSSQTLIDLAKNCPDCYKKFLKFAKEKGLRIQADDITDHVEQIRTKMTQTKEMLQTQTQAAEVVPETVETEAALPPKPNVTLPQGMKWMFNVDTNTWDMVADSQFTY